MPDATASGGGIGSADPYAKANKEYITALFREAHGRDPDQGELDKFVGQQVKDAANVILGPERSPFVGTPGTPPGPGESGGPPLSYEEWLQGPGRSYWEAYQPEYIGGEFDPYYQKLRGGIEYEKELAGEDKELALKDLEDLRGRSTEDLQSLLDEEARNKGWAGEDLEETLRREARGGDLAEEDYIRIIGEIKYGRGLAEEDYTRVLGEMEYEKGLAGEDVKKALFRTERSMGESAASAGLFGSGRYQTELGEQLGDIQEQYERQWGDDPMSQYSRAVAEQSRQFERQYGLGPESAYSRALAEQERGWQRGYGDVDSEYAQRTADYQRSYERQWGEDSEYTTRTGRYQTEHERAMEEYQKQQEGLERGYERAWGTGEYTPYSLRMTELEQQQRLAEETTGLTREQQAWEMHQRQYQPGGVYYQQPMSAY